MPTVRLVVINLDRSANRLARFLSANSFLANVERFAAVDGRELDRHRLVSEGVLDPALVCSDGALGNALSHVGVWKSIAASAAPATTVCEDDAVLNVGFTAEASALLTGLPANWDIVLWGWNFDAYLVVDLLPGVSATKMLCDQSKMRSNLDRYQGLPIKPQPLRLLSACGTLCYAVSADGARKLLARSLPLRPLPIVGARAGITDVPYGLDHAMTMQFPQLDAYVAFPPLAVSPNERSQSTVQLPGPR